MSGRSISDHSDIEPEGTDRAAANKDGLDDNCVEILDITSDGSFTNEGGLRRPSTTGVGNSNTKGSVSFNNHVSNHNEDVLQGLQSFVQDKLNSRYVLTMSEVKRLFQLNLTQSQPGHILSSGVSDQMLEQAVLDVGGIRLNDRVSVFAVIVNNINASFFNCNAKERMLLLEIIYV